MVSSLTGFAGGCILTFARRPVGPLVPLSVNAFTAKNQNQKVMPVTNDVTLISSPFFPCQVGRLTKFAMPLDADIGRKFPVDLVS